MPNESWADTMKRLREWQNLPPSQATAWELRRILLDSTHIRLIGFCAAKRAKIRLEGESWQQWWERELPRLSEQEAMRVLLDVWNKDVWAHLQQLGIQDASLALARARGHAEAPQWHARIGEPECMELFDVLAAAGFNLALAEPSLAGAETWQQADLRTRRAQAGMSVCALALQARSRMRLSFARVRAAQAQAAPLPDSASIRPRPLADHGCAAPASSAPDAAA
jgi:hypothetical protein